MVNYCNLIDNGEFQICRDKTAIWIPSVANSKVTDKNSVNASKCRGQLWLILVTVLIVVVLFLLLLLSAKDRVPFKFSKQDLEASRIEGVFVNNSFRFASNSTQKKTVTFVGSDPRNIFKPKKLQKLVTDDIFWSPFVESLLPKGFDPVQNHQWGEYVRRAVAVKLEPGCGRMHNRLVTFADGQKACVRYRQNTDQIQGELFSFYLAQILHLQNLVPSVTTVVDAASRTWSRITNEMALAQWKPQRPVVLTQYVSNLDVGNIPKLVRPAEGRHLNRIEVESGIDTSEVVELAQWSDLIIFDYLTANLDRVVNNLYNYQWNNNIMEAPAHNLAKEANTNLLVFLDNESGLLHGYRLLEKYEVYHRLLLDNLCVFRRRTAELIFQLKRDGNVGNLLNEMFEQENGENIKDVLPVLPEHSIKILNKRIRRVHDQITKCQTLFKSGHD